MVRVAINGFGRIGRQILQAGISDKRIKWVAVNDLTDPKTLAYLLTYDSVHGRSKEKVSVDGDFLVVNGNRIRVFWRRTPQSCPGRR